MRKCSQINIRLINLDIKALNGVLGRGGGGGGGGREMGTGGCLTQSDSHYIISFYILYP